MSQKTEPKFLMLGAASSILIATFCSRILIMKGAVSGREYSLLSFNPFKMAAYLCWLLVQVIKSALYVSRIALSDKSLVEPSIAWFRADYDSPFARALLANSITLTPGTITIDITDDGIFSVHALTRELREGLLDGSMQAKVAWLYGETIEFTPVDEKEVKPEVQQKRPELVRKRYKVRRKGI
jgi:multicomponent Na+:H+ antiporter subunit E